MDGYTLHETLGEGTFGKVYRATHNDSGESRAVKRMKLDNDEEGIPSTTMREISALKELRHPNIVEIFDVWFDHASGSVNMSMLYCQEDLKKHLRAHSPLSGDAVGAFGLQILEGIAELHARRCMHRDLKPQNILVVNGNRIKIADFGLVRAFQVPIRPLTLEVVTKWYRCPELFLGALKYGCEIDMWSFGCILGELATNTPMFAGDSDIDCLFRIFRLLGTPTTEVWENIEEFKHYNVSFPSFSRATDMETKYPSLKKDGVSVLEALLRYPPHLRMTAVEALATPYFKAMKGKRQ